MVIWTRIMELIISREVNKLILLPQGKQSSTCTANDTVQAFTGKLEFLEICIFRCRFAIFPELKGCCGKVCVGFVFSVWIMKFVKIWSPRYQHEEEKAVAAGWEKGSHFVVYSTREESL